MHRSGCSGWCVLPIRELSARRGLRCSDAAGAAQCGSGEAALCLLPVPYSLSLFFSSLIFFLFQSPPPPPPPPPLLLPFLLQHSSVILHISHSASPTLSSFCFSPTPLLPSFVTSGGSTGLCGRMDGLPVFCSPPVAFGCGDLVKAIDGCRCT